MPGAVNPLHALDLLYKQIFFDILLDILTNTRRILSLCIYYPDHSLPAHALANFLELEKSAFYGALRRLHSVLDIPEPTDAGELGIKFYHASFGDFLRNPSRSGSFSLGELRAQADAAVHSLRWYNYYLGSSCPVKSEALPDPIRGLTQRHLVAFIYHTKLPDIAWALPDKNARSLWAIGRFASKACWRACRLVRDDDVDLVVAELRQFEFRHLVDVEGDFIEFINRLHHLVSVTLIAVSSENQYNVDQGEGRGALLRCQSNSRIDYSLIKGKYCTFDDTLPITVRYDSSYLSK